MNSRLSKVEKTWANLRDSTEANGCLEAMRTSAGISYDEAHQLNQKLCPTDYNPGIQCHTECIFSCVEYDIEMMSKVLRTLAVE